MPHFGYGCAVFLQSDIVAFQRLGWTREELLAGLAAVLPRNVFLYVARVPNLARLGTRFVLQGGTQRNLAAVKAQVDFIRAAFARSGIEPDIVVHKHAGEAGGIGAALEAIAGDCRAARSRHDVHRPRRGRAHHVPHHARRRDALSVLHQRVRAHVHRRLDGRAAPSGGSSWRPAKKAPCEDVDSLRAGQGRARPRRRGQPELRRHRRTRSVEAAAPGARRRSTNRARGAAPGRDPAARATRIARVSASRAC